MAMPTISLMPACRRSQNRKTGRTNTISVNVSPMNSSDSLKAEPNSMYSTPIVRHSPRAFAPACISGLQILRPGAMQ